MSDNGNFAVWDGQRPGIPDGELDDQLQAELAHLAKVEAERAERLNRDRIEQEQIAAAKQRIQELKTAKTRQTFEAAKAEYLAHFSDYEASARALQDAFAATIADVHARFAPLLTQHARVFKATEDHRRAALAPMFELEKAEALQGLTPDEIKGRAYEINLRLKKLVQTGLPFAFPAHLAISTWLPDCGGAVHEKEAIYKFLFQGLLGLALAAGSETLLAHVDAAYEAAR